MVDEGADGLERLEGGVVVDVEREDGAEEFGGEEGVGRVRGGVDGGMDEVARGVVVGASDEELELLIVLGVVDDFSQFGERAGVDDGADEVVEALGRSDFQGLSLGDELGFEGLGDGGGDVDTGCSAAFLAGVLEGAADGVDDGVLEISGFVDEMEVLAAGFADDARVTAVGGMGDALADFAVEGAEDGGAAGVMERGELRMGEDDAGDGFGVAGDKLNNVRREPGFEQDVVEDIV